MWTFITIAVVAFAVSLDILKAQADKARADKEQWDRRLQEDRRAADAENLERKVAEFERAARGRRLAVSITPGDMRRARQRIFS